MQACFAGSKSKPHTHTGVLTPYNNHHVSYSITTEQQAKIDAGEPVRFIFSVYLGLTVNIDVPLLR
ncbi:hypothetical protein EON65_31450 [archaeon]|nr:MAG: hypothetical protein EON65_31450 [archaeon]